MEDLYQRLTEYSKSDYYPYHMPGHKRQPSGSVLDSVFSIDITEIDGFDNLHEAEGLIANSQQASGRFYGAEETFYLINGSTSGVLSAISAAVEQGGRILLARNSHKSAYHGVYLRKLKVTYLYPEYDEEGIARGIRAEQVQQALEQEPEIQAVFLTSPTYEGRVSEIEKIAQIVHEHGIPLIVDEAHGAHFGIHPAWPQTSCRNGADIVIQSVHKTLPSMTQTALLHVNGARIDKERLRRFLRIYQSSSPSYVLMASIEQAIVQTEQNGKELFEKFIRQWKEMLTALTACQRIRVLPTDDVGKLILSVKGTDISGQELYDILLKEYHLQLEMSAPTYVLAMFTAWDNREGYKRMTDAILDIDKRLKAEPEEPAMLIPGKKQEAAILLSDAWDGAKEEVLLSESIGRSAGEFVNLYPPGIPILVPGEEISPEEVMLLQDLCQKHLPVQGIQKENGLQKVIVLKENRQDVSE